MPMQGLNWHVTASCLRKADSLSDLKSDEKNGFDYMDDMVICDIVDELVLRRAFFRLPRL